VLRVDGLDVLGHVDSGSDFSLKVSERARALKQPSPGCEGWTVKLPSQRDLTTRYICCAMVTQC
jgi:hypothetical protein